MYTAVKYDLSPCLYKKYWLINIFKTFIKRQHDCSIFLDAHILFICCASKKALRLILEENFCIHALRK